MSLGKKLFIGGGGAACFTDSVQPFGADSAYSSNVALYQLNGNANDTVGNYNGTASNVTYSTGKYGNAAVFNGSSSKIELPSALSNGSTIAASCISFWFNVGAEVTSSTSNNEIMQFAGTSSLTGKIALGSTSGHMSGETFSVTHNVSGVYTYSTTNIPAGWNHAVVQWNSSDGKWDIYINSVKHTTYTVGTNAQGYFKLKFGNRSSVYYTGSLDQVRIYDKALSSVEVGVLYNETTSTASDTNVLNEGSGVALYTLDYDASDAGGNYNGTPTDVTFGVDGQINYGASFNGTSSSIDIGTISELPSNTNNEVDFTFSAWVKSNTADLNAGGGSNPIFVNQNNSYQFIGFGGNDNANFPTGRIFYYTFGGSGQHNSWIITDETFDDDNWHHVVVTDVYNPGTNNRTRTLYVDNVQRKQDTVDKNFNANTVSTYLGSTSNAYSKQYLDQVRIFSKGLSSSEISSLYGETACVYTSTTDTVNYQGTNLAYYKFDNTTEDETGNHDGTGYNLSYTFGRFGQCADFNGLTSSSGTYISVPHNTSFSWKNNKTLSLWFKLDSYLSGSRGLAAKGNGGSGPYGWYLYKNGSDNKIGFTYYDSAVNAATLVTNNAVDLNTWYHLCITTNGTTDRLYLNGVEEDSTSSIVGIDVNTPLVIGRFYSNFTDYNIDGQIDQVRFYESTLDATAVANLYNEKQEAELNFNAVLYNGTDSDRYVSNIGFQPDLVWIKRRNSTNAAVIQDSVRGANNYIMPHSSSAEASSTSFDSFEANGFELTGAGGSWNNSAGTYVAWVWKGGGDAVSNTNGTITSQVSANTAAGFSIVKYTGNGTDNATVGTGLSSAAELVIVKDLTSANYWCVGGSAVGNGENLYLNETGQKLTRDRVKSVQTNTFTLGNHLETNSTNNFIAYCFHSVSGYQKIGSFTYSAGVSVNVGFEPQFVMFKKTSAAGSWTIVDNKRFSGTTDYGLFANLDAAEVTNTDYLNLTSTGFTTTYSDTGTFIYLAIA